jgi:choline dehydrogenase
MAPSQLGGFARSSPDATPNVEFHVQPLSLDKFGDPLHPFPAFTASVCNLRPTSRGLVRIRSADPRAHPAIMLNYLSTPADRKVAADALRLARKVAAQPALAKYQPSEFKPGAEYQSDDELVKAAGDVGTTIFHPVGTCKMGVASDPNAVVDSRLRVIGMEHLRVVDASVMPTHLGQHQPSTVAVPGAGRSDPRRPEDARLAPTSRAAGCVRSRRARTGTDPRASPPSPARSARASSTRSSTR